MADRGWKLAAVDAAAGLTTTGRQHHPGYRDRMRVIVEAVEPLIRADERRQVIAELESDEAVERLAAHRAENDGCYEPGRRFAELPSGVQDMWRQSSRNLLAEARSTLIRASLLAPEGEGDSGYDNGNDKVVAGNPVPYKLTITGSKHEIPAGSSAASSGPGRAKWEYQLIGWDDGDGEPDALGVPMCENAARWDLSRFEQPSAAPYDHVGLRRRVAYEPGPWESVQVDTPAAAHEEGSAHG